MNKNEIVYINEHGLRPGRKYYETLKKGIEEFIKNDDAWYRNLSDNEGRVYNVHVECSYLCHAIWTRIMKNKMNNGNPYSNNYMEWSADMSADRSMRFHFDIMNNPKKQSCGLANICEEKLRQKWENVYHSVGNMTPTPWFKLDGEHYIDMQALHNSVDERWDIFLRVLRNNWNAWQKNGGITFEEYMKLTCQQVYYKDVIDDIREKKISAKSITKENVDNWNNKLITKDSELVTFSIADGENPNEIIKMIIELITARSTIMKLYI